MGKQIQLSIADPCHESWDHMTTAEQGRFCASCQKQVVDFTNMTDAQLAAYFKKPGNGSVCGRFYDDQLSRNIPAPRKTIPWIKYFFQIALPAFLMSTRAAAQGKVMIKTETTIDKGYVSGNTTEASVKPDNKNIVRGKIVDENNVPVPNASVLIKGINDNIVTDTAGSFVIKDLPYRATLVLEVTALGYQSTQTVITPYTDLKKELFISLNKIRRNERAVGMIQVIMGKPAFRPKPKVPKRLN